MEAVVGSHHHQACMHAGNGRVDKGIGRHVHAHMLHAHHGTASSIGHAQGRLHGRLFVGTPAAVHTTTACEGVGLDKFRNLGRGSAGVGIDASQSCVYGTQGYGLVSQ